MEKEITHATCYLKWKTISSMAYGLLHGMQLFSFAFLNVWLQIFKTKIKQKVVPTEAFLTSHTFLHICPQELILFFKLKFYLPHQDWNQSSWSYLESSTSFYLLSHHNGLEHSSGMTAATTLLFPSSTHTVLQLSLHPASQIISLPSLLNKWTNEWLIHRGRSNNSNNNLLLCIKICLYP